MEKRFSMLKIGTTFYREAYNHDSGEYYLDDSIVWMKVGAIVVEFPNWGERIEYNSVAVCGDARYNGTFMEVLPMAVVYTVDVMVKR